MSKYKNNFNPIFINNYFKQLNNLFDKNDLKLEDKLDLIYNDYLIDADNNFDKYYNGLFYCCNYIISLRKYYYIKTHPVNDADNDHICFTNNNFIEFLNLYKSTIIKRYNNHIFNKQIMKLIITAYLKVNELYNIALKRNLFI